MSLWLETATARYPGTRGTYGLGGLDTLRLRLDSSFGTALDMAGAGDSLLLWMPSQRALVRLDAGAPPLALPDAAAFGVRHRHDQPTAGFRARRKKSSSTTWSPS